MVTKKKKKPKSRVYKMSEEERTKRRERMKEVQRIMLEETKVTFRVTVTQYQNERARVKFEYRDDKYRPSRRILDTVWRDLIKEYRVWQYNKKKEELAKWRETPTDPKPEPIPAPVLDTDVDIASDTDTETNEEVNVINELDEELANA